MAGLLKGPPCNCTASSGFRNCRALLHDISWSDNWTQSAVRIAVLNHGAALFGGDSDGGRNDHSAHIGAHFWNVASVRSGWERPDCDSIPLILLVMGTNQLESQFRDRFAVVPTNPFTGTAGT
jgi:hypothetical protein